MQQGGEKRDRYLEAGAAAGALHCVAAVYGTTRSRAWGKGCKGAQQTVKAGASASRCRCKCQMTAQRACRCALHGGHSVPGRWAAPGETQHHTPGCPARGPPRRSRSARAARLRGGNMTGQAGRLEASRLSVLLRAQSMRS